MGIVSQTKEDLLAQKLGQIEPAAAALVSRLGLAPHPEGGFFREIYRSAVTVQKGPAVRSAFTCIYFLLAAGQLSRWHAVASDEMWQFVEGGALELFSYNPQSGVLDKTVLGAAETEKRSFVVPADHWQAARPLGAHALVTCVVAPGFDFADFQFVADMPAHPPHFQRTLAPYQSLL